MINLLQSQFSIICFYHDKMKSVQNSVLGLEMGRGGDSEMTRKHFQARGMTSEPRYHLHVYENIIALPL